ncbi:MAG: FHA domain-containing protein [Chloroflexi bacterium]|jgi:hypothetical protein|uniref:FHA domain-containing protein n=1 Tax=Candidatus Thermofonsia Clade 3 bacterium TaxID=2364212 RepID=A0A2M8QFL7_9CHLR|nr:FHA domain-containing protein [Candidatus Roseilinea sp. NK_OTU-006]PJF48615.1 MAG: hypothetical protein CUN48_02715 [Candidatus Thermofonsia Clade 3 bacterium]RMG62426.1 MAG: FHA domain-containing protein [Chloroflexota bacterium]
MNAPFPLYDVVATCADAALLGIGGLAGLFGLFSRRRAPRTPSAYLVIGGKRFPLTEPIRLGRTSWYRITGKSVADLAEEHAEIFRAPDGMWEARLLAGEHMFVDGRRSRHNRLRSGATISLGKSQQVVFQFMLQN